MADVTVSDNSGQTCPDQEVIRKFERGELPIHEVDRIADHMGTCAQCGAVYAKLFQAGRHGLPEGMVASIRQLPDLGSGTDFTDRMKGFALNPDHAPVFESESQAEGFGRYRIKKKLGEGSFGTVYLADDPVLHRSVALKVSRWKDPKRSHSLFAREAKNAAQLRDPALVSIFDIGWEPDGRCYLVLEYVEGSDLQTLMRNGALSVADSFALSIELARALAALHGHGILHRDLKPANVLVSDDRRVKITDFGLSVDDSYRQSLADAYAGTLDYMAPEQVRGEAHRFDVRTDIWSFGVILYQLFTGTKPFAADDKALVQDAIEYVEPKEPSELVSSIPKLLDRVIMRCLAKRMSKRYSSMSEVIEDLTGASLSDAPELPRKVLSRGLQPYSAADHEEYVLLTPGLRDKDGLPELIANWKRRLEDPNGFSVGVVMGPSGVGKSSFFQAGLIPSLSPAITSIYLRLDANWSENDIAEALKAEFPDLNANYDCRECLLQLRHRTPMLPSGKTLIVLDQFEQFLCSEEKWASLANALRQCDGKHVAVILSVRDDYFLALSRFMSVIDVQLQTESNFGTIDLFDLTHARQVLCLFGAASGKCKEVYDSCSKSERSFIENALLQLTNHDRISPLHLALFCDVTRYIEWSAKANLQLDLRNLGVAYLEASMSSSGSSTGVDRFACITILQALLPDAELANKVCSLNELATVAGLDENSAILREALRFLTNDLRILVSRRESSNLPIGERTQYRLTHDFLVQSIRDWIDLTQLKTKSGRVMQVLRTRSTVWQRERIARHLPSLAEFTSIILGTKSSLWQLHDRAMMRAAGNYYAVRLSLLSLLCICIIGAGYWGSVVVNNLFEEDRRSTAVRLLGTGSVSHAIELIEQPKFAEQKLGELIQLRLEDGKLSISQRLNLTLAIADSDQQQINRALRLLLSEDVTWLEFERVIQFVRRRSASFNAEYFETLVNKPTATDSRSVAHRKGEAIRLRAAIVLWELKGQHQASQTDWSSNSEALSRSLIDAVETSADSLPVLVRLVRNGREPLYPSLIRMFEDESDTSVQLWATELLDLLTRDDLHKRSELLLVANRQQFGHLASGSESGSQFVDQCRPRINSDSVSPLGRANAILAMCCFGYHDEVWQYFRQTSDPTTRSHLIDRISLGFITPEKLLERLDAEEDVSAKRAIVLALGRLCDDPLSHENAQRIKAKIATVESESTDPGLASACDWAQQQLGEPIDFEPKADANKYGLIQLGGHVFARVQGPQHFTMGSPKTEPRRYFKEEDQHDVTIPYSFIITITEVTENQYGRFHSGKHTLDLPSSNLSVKPQTQVSWYDAAAYCNWLTKASGLDDSEQCYVEYSPKKFREVDDAVKRRGFRIPTTAEWELACRAGTKSSRHYGDDAELIDRYAHLDHEYEQINPCGRLLPNDLGLFDTLGNLREWNHDRYTFDAPTDRIVRAIRGGSYFFTTARVRSASVDRMDEEIALFDVGFRVVQTVGNTEPQEQNPDG